jgi:SAM-dependent methyltransferase
MGGHEEQNRRSWNAATPVHNAHKGDQAGFLKAGGSTLFPEETGLLGEVRGTSVLHLQCNSGQDSLSIAALGAEVTGVDISDEAIAFARALSEASGIPARFHRAEVVDWLREAAAEGRRFDTAFVSYGSLFWLPDLPAWAQGVASVLAPGGRLVMVEFHPFALSLDETWTLRHDYFAEGPLIDPEGVGDYVGRSGDGLAGSGPAGQTRSFANPHPSVGFAWGIGRILSALLAADLRIAHFAEYPWLNGWKRFDRMERGEGRRMHAPADMPSVPLMFSLGAVRTE